MALIMQAVTSTTCARLPKLRNSSTQMKGLASRGVFGTRELAKLQREPAAVNGWRIRAQHKHQVFMLQRVADPERQKESKVEVKLGDYKNGALQIHIEPTEVDEAAVDAELEKKMKTTYKLNRVNFTGSGAKMGHTVKINMEGKFADGPKAGQSVPGTKANMFELELTEGKTGIFAQFVEEIVSKGMGQEESKSFVVQFPEDYAKEQLRGVNVRFAVTVKEISVREELPKDTRPVEEQRAEIRAAHAAAAQRRTEEAMDAAIRTVLERTCEADTQKVADSVSWAKFGPKSMAEFTWNLILEEISMVEKIPFNEVPGFLRSHAVVAASDAEEDEAEEELSFD